MYDVIIIGMGPAGMSAAIYAKRSGLRTLILESGLPGGLLNKISVINNYLGFGEIDGSTLNEYMTEHIRKENVEFRLEKVLNIIDLGSKKKIVTSKSKYLTKSVIIAVGRKNKKSGLINESKFIGKGISYCAICDAPLYKNKDIIVLGGGNSAFEEALYLSKFAKSIKILVRNNISAIKNLVDNVKKTKNIEIIKKVEVIDFLGEDYITGVKLKDGKTINCDGVFIYYGFEAETNFIRDLNITNDKGYIEVDENMRTKVKKIYACGDIIQKNVYQIVTAVSEGAIAATSARKDIK